MLVLKELDYAIDAKNEQLLAYPLDASGHPILSKAIQINSIENELISHELRKFLQVLTIPQLRVCHVCGITFESKRSSKTTHDNTCRSTKRHITNKLRSIGADNKEFMTEFGLHVNALNANAIERAKDYLLKNMESYKAVIQALTQRDLKYLILSNQ
ncbi:MAG: hypothetical protein KU29_11955 [Sulfurovum sp. FS06-10]|nr:MAG: hypothetical protein KU29_11955 [Sulfurovum sp. FS06-10]